MSKETPVVTQMEELDHAHLWIVLSVTMHRLKLK